MMNIRLTHIRQADLNLLAYFAVLAEEGNISRAAKRLRLSQPSASRALGRLRLLFGDDLLVRGLSGHELTPRGQALLEEMAEILPRIDRLIAGAAFDPQREKARFRICATDNTTHLFSGVLCRHLPRWSKASFDFQPWNDLAYEDLERGRTDLVLKAEDGSLPTHLRSEVLLADEFVCVVAKEHPLQRRLTLKQYLASAHVNVSMLGHRQTIPERVLAKHGVRRRDVFTVPYFLAAIHVVAGTQLVVTVPRRLAESLANRETTKLLPPPRELGSLSYLMAWHPRLESDAQSRWLRHAMRDAAKEISLRPKSPGPSA